MTDAKAIPLLSCPDQKGLVVTVPPFIFQRHAECRTQVHGVKTVNLE